MLDETIENLKIKIQDAVTLSDNKKAELLTLIGSLSEEINDLSKTKPEESESITKFTEASTHEALKTNKNSQLTDISLEGLKKSIEGFETSHPELTKTINKICTTLAGFGI